MPETGGWSSVLQLDFGPEAEAIEDGERRYGDQELEYPPPHARLDLARPSRAPHQAGALPAGTNRTIA